MWDFADRQKSNHVWSLVIFWMQAIITQMFPLLDSGCWSTSSRSRKDLSERRAVRASVCLFYTYLGFLHGSSRRADLPEKLLGDAPLSLLTFSSVLLILPFHLWESRRFCHSLPLTAEWWRSELLTLAFFLEKRFKKGNVSGWRSADDGGVEGCRPRQLLQFSPSSGFIYSLSSVTCFPSLQPVLLKVQDTFPLLPFLLFVWKSCLNYMETFFVTDMLMIWNTLFEALKSHGKG